jgi:hypothetical protein
MVVFGESEKTEDPSAPLRSGRDDKTEIFTAPPGMTNLKFLGSLRDDKMKGSG